VDVALVLRQRLKELEFEQRDLARAAQVTQSYISQLLTGKKAYVFVTRGGVYGAEHTHTRYVRDFLAFVGITDVEFIYAEGLAISPASKDAALAKAREVIERLSLKKPEYALT